MMKDTIIDTTRQDESLKSSHVLQNERKTIQDRKLLKMLKQQDSVHD